MSYGQSSAGRLHVACVGRSLAVAVAFAGFAREHPEWWEAAISLAVLGGIFPMILSVNSRIVPGFSRRDWVSNRRVGAMVVLAIAGGWIVCFRAGART